MPAFEGREKVLITKEWCEGIFGGDRTVLYIGCDEGYIILLVKQNTELYTMDFTLCKLKYF